MKIYHSFEKKDFDEERNEITSEYLWESETISMPTMYLFLKISALILLLVIGVGGSIVFTFLAAKVAEWYASFIVVTFIVGMLGGSVWEEADDWLQGYCMQTGVWAHTSELYFIHNNTEEEKAETWRKKHELEEKCRLAMTKNPNYVADLIRYVKDKNL